MDFKTLILQFLNTNDSTINVVNQEQITVMELLFKGGIMMIPILVLFVITIYILIEKILIINRESKSPKGFTDEIISRVKNDDINGAILVCNDTNNPVSRMILKGLNKLNTSLKNIESSIENVGKIEIYNLEKNLNLLATISGAAPMIGFLGTVTGMIQAFISIAEEEGAVSHLQLARGDRAWAPAASADGARAVADARLRAPDAARDRHAPQRAGGRRRRRRRRGGGGC